MNKLALIASANNNRGGVVPTPSDLVLWQASTSVDDQPTGDGDTFWANPQAVGIRASLHYDETAYSIETVDGREYYKIYLDPDTPDPSPNDSNYRAEIARNVTNKVLGTVRMVGAGFRFPTILNHGGELIIGQWKSGTGVGGPYPSNHPVIYHGLAYAGQGGASENEFVIIRKVVAFEETSSGRINTGIIIQPGTEYFTREYLIGGTNGSGYYRIDMKVGRGGAWQTLYAATESTAWDQDEDGGSVSQVTPYWTKGMYAQNISTDAEVASEKALNGGTYNITMYLLDKIKCADLLAADPYYAYPISTMIRSVDTSI